MTIAPAVGTGAPAPALPRTEGRAERRLVLAAVAGIVALGVAFRFYTRADLWSDEVLAVNIARLPLEQLPEALRRDGAPPLYYLLLGGWIRLMGDKAAVRALSGVIGTLTLVPLWYAGCRLDARRVRLGLQGPGERPVALATVVLGASSPFAIRYATEARMYALVIALVAVGYLAVWRAWEQPRPSRLAVVAVVAAALCYTHYWAFALGVVVSAVLAWLALRAPAVADRRRARRLLAALGGAVVLFLPWAPTLWFQLRRTGTPWADPPGLLAGLGEAFKAFGGNVSVVGWAFLLMVLLALFARGVDERHVELDLWTRPGVRLEIGIALATLAVGFALAHLSGTTFEGRYASVMFPPYLLGAAFAATVFVARPVRYGVLVLLVLGGFWGGTSNALRNRTQAFEVVNAIVAEGRPGDVVVYCPDAIGVDVSAQLAERFPGRLREVSLPGPGRPVRIDWRDYDDRFRRVDPGRVAARLDRLAPDHQVWFVWTPGPARHAGRCDRVMDALAATRPQPQRPVEPDPYFFEHHGLVRFGPLRR